MPVEGGAWRHELAGEDPPAEAFARLRGLLGAEEWILLEDPAAGIFRAAALAGGTLAGAIAVAPEPCLPPRAWLATLMTSGVLAPEDRAALLVGRRAGGPPPSPVICACHAVTEAVIAACGANDLDGVGKATGAGTGCGSCRPEIARLLTRETA